ncbi:MAG TPA: hypothetical protein VKD25_04960 [Burkholderiales bacterium]|nr:hypothetical protein [Burkholderiales bacterium]
MMRIATILAGLALLASCATTPQVSPGERPAQKDGNRSRTVTPTWESDSHIEISGSI